MAVQSSDSAGVHVKEHLSLILGLEVNLFPSRVIFRTNQGSFTPKQSNSQSRESCDNKCLTLSGHLRSHDIKKKVEK